MQVTTIQSAAAAAKPVGYTRPANFDPTAGAETPGVFDAPLPKPAPDKKVATASYDPTASAESAGTSHQTEAGEMSFWDFVDVINPLQHLPVVGTIYRALTGDTINSTARIMGGALYGGPVGMLSGVASAIYEQTAGTDIETQLTQLVTGTPEAPTRVAAADAAKASVPTAPAAAASGGVPAMASAAAPETAETPAVAAEAAKAAGPSPLFHSLQKPARSGHGPAPVIEVRPRPVDQAQPVAPARTPAPAAAPANQAATAAQPAGSPPALPQELVADMMMGALNKYEKMKRTGQGTNQALNQSL